LKSRFLGFSGVISPTKGSHIGVWHHHAWGLFPTSCTLCIIVVKESHILTSQPSRQLYKFFYITAFLKLNYNYVCSVERLLLKETWMYDFLYSGGECDGAVENKNNWMSSCSHGIGWVVLSLLKFSYTTDIQSLEIEMQYLWSCACTCTSYNTHSGIFHSK